MRHHVAFELLPLLSLDALEDTDRRRVESHVSHCPACQKELARYSAVAEALAGELEPSPATWDRIVERIHAH